MKSLITFLVLSLLSSCALPKQTVSDTVNQKRIAYTKVHGEPRNPLFNPSHWTNYWR
jgi:hypothetical protein